MNQLWIAQNKNYKHIFSSKWTQESLKTKKKQSQTLLTGWRGWMGEWSVRDLCLELELFGSFLGAGVDGYTTEVDLLRLRGREPFCWCWWKRKAAARACWWMRASSNSSFSSFFLVLLVEEEFGKRFEGFFVKVAPLGVKHAHEFPICYANACKSEKEAHMIPMWMESLC